MRGHFWRMSLSVAVAAAPLLLGGCSNGARRPGKVRVVATYSVLGDLVKNVAGDSAEVVTLVGPDGDARTPGVCFDRGVRPVAGHVRQAGRVGQGGESAGRLRRERPQPQTHGAAGDRSGEKLAPPLFTDALGKPCSEGDTYEKMVRHNVAAIVDALKP